MDNKILKPLTGNLKKYPVAVFDIEAREWTNLLMIGFYDGNNYREFFTIQSFLDFICRDKYRSYRIYAHNGGRYDFLFLFKFLKSESDILDINGRIFQIKIKLPQKRIIVLVDSYYLLPYSLDKLIKTFTPRSRYKKIDVDFTNLKLDANLKKHCENDCKALYEIINKFQDVINSLGGELKTTTAATALDLFRRKYLSTELPTYFEHEENIRSSYFGGRCEVFKKHLKGGYYYDFNSLYPSVMADNCYPCGKPYYIDNYKLSSSDVGFAYLETRIIDNVPLLPFRSNGMLIFPCGSIRGIYSLEFIKNLQQRKIPFKLSGAYLFDRMNIFKDYVNDLYFLRLENKNNVISEISKLMLNSLYGKFGQKIERKKFIFNPDFEKIINLKLYSSEHNIFYDDINLFLPYILPAIASYVTTYGQLKLYQYLDSDTYYCDTDSIITTKKLNTSKNLGELKLENKIIEGILLTQKVYALMVEGSKKSIKRAKGFPKETIRNFTFKDFKTALTNNDYSKFNVAYRSIYGWKESIIRKKTELINYDNRVKSIKTIDTKRKFYSKNNSVPFMLDN